jgi:outer membrane lipoprotein-sorting protein
MQLTFQTVRRSAVAAAAVAVALVGSTAGVAQAQLPTVAQVYDKYAAAVGGREAWGKVSDRGEKGTALITFAGMSATYERYYSAPNKFRMIIDLGMGKVEQGTDGSTVWSGQPDGSVAKMPPEDAAYVLEGNVTGNAFLDPTRFAKVAVVGQEEFDGVPCYKVSITTKSGRERTDYFEVATGLRRGQVLQTPNGAQSAKFRDYKAFDGKSVATTVVQSNPQGDIIITITSVVFTPSDPKLFELPAGIAK